MSDVISFRSKKESLCSLSNQVPFSLKKRIEEMVEMLVLMDEFEQRTGIDTFDCHYCLIMGFGRYISE